MLAAACAAAACQKTPDCFGIDPGDRVAITVMDVYEQGVYATSFPCGFGFDISQGLMLVATDLSNPDSNAEGATCNSAAVRVDPFAGWTWTSAGTSVGYDPTVLTGNFSATNGACSGSVSMTLTVTSNGQPFAASEAGATPNVLMQRTFSGPDGGGPGCPHTCIDYYSVNLTRL